jgi:hypothetical protein
MGRDSNKHGARVDDELKREVESLTRGAPVEARRQPGRELEGPADYEPTPSARVADMEAGGRVDPLSIAPSATLARRELNRHLEPNVFPATRDDLLESARRLNAPLQIIDVLEQTPSGLQFETLHELWFALTGITDGR